MKKQFTVRLGLSALLVAGLTGGASAQGRAANAAAVQQLTASGGIATVNEATGTVKFFRLPASAAPAIAAPQGGPAARRSTAEGFLRQHGAAFGLADPASDLVLVGERTDSIGQTHLVYSQQYNGIPVFGASMRAHFAAGDALSVVNGVLVPDISVPTTPARSEGDAARVAYTAVAMDTAASNLSARPGRLVIFREGLAKGVPGDNHLAWEIEVGNGVEARVFVYVDAMSGKIVDQISGVVDAMYRRAYDGRNLNGVPPEYPNTPFWVEGNPFPTGVTEADNMIQASKEVYDMFVRGFGRDSFDGSGAILDSIFNRGYSCPNASWNGVFISFCPGFTTDDVTAHEWGHAYTQYTDNLIYQWQPGALNESYSDIWGETLDLINGRGVDAPGTLRSANSCSAFIRLPGELVINAPAGIAGTYLAQAAQFGPNLTSGVTGNVVIGLDPADAAGPSTTDACSPLTNGAAVAGNIAIVDRGTCNFSAKVYNAQLAGAIGVIVANNVASGLPGMGAGVNAALVTIPSLGVTQATGNSLKANIATANATIRARGGVIDNSYRWLMGEEVTPGGSLRDMWNPTCFSNPGKVSDTQFYVCSTTDQGGVHTNSGIPNHAYALLVDGGTFNGHTVNAIGLTKAAAIYWRAQTVYQGPASNFTDHADAIEQSCSDLIGAALNDLTTGGVSSDVIAAADCQAVTEAVAAVELRTPPTFCNFQPMLAKNPPDRCAPGETQSNLLFADFENGAAGWGASHLGVTADFTPRDWSVVNNLPRRAGSAFFAEDFTGGTCAPGGDESGVQYLDSPAVTVPSGVSNPLLTFDHWVATELGWDGGNVRISVNGGPWTLVAPADITYNNYNFLMATGAQGNTSPLAGEPGWTGADGGAVDGSWGRTHVRLAPYAAPGSTVRLRFSLGNDGCGGTFGWYVDDVTLYACTPSATPDISVDDIRITEGNVGTKNATFTVSLSHAFDKAVSVKYKFLPGTAKSNSDYMAYETASITIPALTTSAQVNVKIVGDKKREADETFTVKLIDPINAMFGKNIGVCTIVNDDQ